MAIEITSPSNNSKYSAELGLNVKWAGSEGHVIVTVYWGGFDNPVERTIRHSYEGDADYGNVTIPVPESIRPIAGSLPCWIQLTGAPQASNPVEFFMAERPILNGITVISPQSGSAARTDSPLRYTFSGLNAGVSGSVRVAASSSNYLKTYGSATYVGDLGATSTLEIPIDLDGASYDANAHLVATITAAGYLGAHDNTSVRLAEPTEASVAIVGTVDTDGTKRITDWPAHVVGTLMDSVDGATPPVRLVTIYNETSGERMSYDLDVAQDGSFAFDITESSHVPIANGDRVWLRVHGSNSFGLTFSKDSYDIYLVDIHAPSIGSATFEDVLDDGSVKATFYAYDDDPLTPNPISGKIYAEKPDGSLKLLREWGQADWDATQGVITAVNEFCAVSQPVRYVFESVSSAGEKSSLTAYHAMESPYFYMHWGQGRGADAIVTRARWNPEASWSAKPANVELIHYMGRALPVMARSKAVEENMTFSFVLQTIEEAEKLRKLAASYGRCYYRGADGVVCHAYIEAQGKPRYTLLSKHVEASVSMTKIDGSIR